MKSKYTKEILAPAVAQSTSWRELLELLGLKWSGGAIQQFKTLLNKFQIDTSHFVGHAHNKGKTVGFRYPIEEYYNGRSITTHDLRLRLLKEGIKPHKCEVCDNSLWLGEPIPLELHHIDGNNKNNGFENLQMICPNCHAKTDNHAGKGRKKHGV